MWKSFRARWWLWAGLAIVAAAGFMLLPSPPGPSVRRGITVSMDANGKTRIAGVPMPTTNLRDAAFSALGAAGVQAEFRVPLDITNQAQASNVLETLKSMGRAGLLPADRKPNPYD